MKRLQRLFSGRWMQKTYTLSVLNQQNSLSNNCSTEDVKKESNLNCHLFVGATVLAYLSYKLFYEEYVAYLKEIKTLVKPGALKENLPNYTLKQVAEHREREKRIWVTYKDGVYDITEFVDAHPGGDQILLAAGASVEPFWKLYGQHHADFVYEILESLRIGNLVDDQKPSSTTSDFSDPFIKEPIRHAALIPASEKPFNAELPPTLLVANFITPNELFYVRNHLPVPEVDPKKYELEVDVEGTNKSIKLTVESLKKLPKHTITATIMCAGNRRSEMTEVKPVKGLSWGVGALGNAEWSGVLLRDVLISMGIDENSNFQHVQFEGLDTDPTKKPYGASIPFWKAIDRKGDVLLAYEMNNEVIPRDHGFPVRVIVPGVVGARNVKWLKRIIVSNNESDSHWQQNDYKGFSPGIDWDNVDFSKSPAIQELPVTSAICVPSPNQTVTVRDGHITAYGYAWSGGGKKIIRVDVTIDKGDTWHVADIIQQDSAEPPQHWGWSLWTVQVPVSKNAKEVEIWVKAVDSSYNTQPESFKNIWNLRGVLSNAYHKVPIKLQWD
ncbi:probable sulfite oxidase, mitochondrial [Agrilus planipennis]|uniref:sulfite oxidase n=1 Tax=Agrilus planipennis TaxID=224129 RepID=A0A7F5R783_AGRPL|nr:probable sulfite oxidase, mitochondrial [Agrilus planipennis]